MFIQVILLGINLLNIQLTFMGVMSLIQLEYLLENYLLLHQLVGYNILTYVY